MVINSAKTITWCAAIMWLVIAILCATAGCFTRTIYVPDGKAVRLRQTIHNARVWVKTRDGKVVKGKLDLNEGWYVVPESSPPLPAAHQK